MINKFRIVTIIVLLNLFNNVHGQVIMQLGYYSVNGIFGMSSKTNYMILGNGAMVNISNPTSPVLTGSLSLNGTGSSVLVDGNYAYYGTGMNVTLFVANITNLQFPVVTASRVFSLNYNGIFGLAKKDNVLYAAMGNGGVFSIDVSNASSPIILDSLVIPNGQARQIVIKGSYAYVAHSDGLKIINITNPSNLSLVTSIGSGYSSIDIDNNLAFVGKNSGGVDVFNISNPLFPQPAFAIVNSDGTAWGIKCQNHLAYLATNNSGLYIYKYVNNTVVQKAHFDNAGNGQSFAVSLQDNYILLTGLINGVAILQYDSLGYVGIDDSPTAGTIDIWPNPAGNYFEYRLGEQKITDLQITDIYGRTLMRIQAADIPKRIDMSAMPAGNYIVNFSNKEINLSKKLIKIE